MTHHKTAANLIRAVAIQLELLVGKVQDQTDKVVPEASRPYASCARKEKLEERRDGIEEAICDLLNAAENLELIP